MGVDVSTSRIIARPRSEVHAFASDRRDATRWYSRIERVEWRGGDAPAAGVEAAFVACFLGREMACTHRIVEPEPERRPVMRTADGPFPMAG